MHFASADQKPSLFNNAGHTGTFQKKGRNVQGVWENFAAMRQRYTILTIVTTYCDYTADGTGTPPHIFILFKGKKDGKIQKDLAEMDLPPWVHIQVQECGSYREEDVIDALRIFLPVAGSTRESMVVLLDWFSAHRTEAVIAFIESRGHVALFHGGGCTAFTQINDTHLHALLARLLIQLENKVMHAARVDMHLNNQGGVPSLNRTDIVEVNMAAWKMINHKKIAQKGYEQTGPRMPMNGPIKRDDVYKDLRQVFDEIDPPVGLQEVGTTIRDEARAFVLAGWPRRWSRWEHCKRLIIDHDQEDDPIPEGFEMANYTYAHSDSDEDPVEEPYDDLDLGDPDEDGDDPPPPGGSTAASSSEVALVTSPGQSSGSSTKAADSMNVAQAREVLISHARKQKDDVSLRRLLSQRDEASATDKAAATETAIILQKVAFAEMEERREKRKVSKSEQSKARLDEKLSEQRKAEAKERAAAIKLQILKQEEIALKANNAKKAAEKKDRESSAWLQLEYPRMLATRMHRKFATMPAPQRKIYDDKVVELAGQRWFRYMPPMPALWAANQNMLIRHSSVLSI